MTRSVRQLLILAAISCGFLGTSLSHAVDVGSAVETGSLPSHWAAGGPDCNKLPPFQIHPYNNDFYILRESGCLHAEKPFLFLIFGTDQALLFDTGAGGEQGAKAEPDVAAAVHTALTRWAAQTHHPLPKLIASHLHSHGDHTYGDPQLAKLPNTTLVPPNDVAALQAAFKIKTWPTDIGHIDLGARIIDIIPIPGHDDTSIAAYDRRTGVLLTGDTLYPGRIYINAAPAVFAASVQRLVDFTKDKLVTYALGTHVEQKAPYSDYPVGTHYAPVELPLQLSRGNLLELLEATTHHDAAGKIVQRAFSQFSVCGAYPDCSALDSKR
jgi:hydroxyacylglutathione hydrolase